MKRARRFPQQLVRWTSLYVCFALVLTSLAMVPLPLVSSKGSIFSTQGQGNQGSPNGKGQKVKPAPPEKGAPAANLPNLDEVKRRHDPEPEAPTHIPSSMRSKRNPLVSRKGRKVGDPLPIAGQASAVSSQPNAVVAGAPRVRNNASRGGERFNHRGSAMPTPTVRQA